MSRQSPPVYRLNPLRILALISRARVLRQRETWSREEIRRHQDRELARLRQFVSAHSPFYQRFHKGLEDRPLHELPILTKKELMQSWNDIVTDRSLHLEDIQRFLERVQGLERYRNTHYAFATGGTTGVKGVTVYSKKEFLRWFALTSRTTRWAGMRFSLRERPRISTVQSLLPWHVAGGAAFIRLPLVKTLPLDTTEPLPQLVRKLNDFQPHVLGGFAGNIHLLAQEQIAGRLRIAPRTVLCTAETLKKEARQEIEEAWKTKPFEAYGATETAEAASECQEHRGLHIYEDAVILEVVDEDNRPVPPGKFGKKVLATVLWNYTLPLIRYEISDHLKLSTEACPCGRTFQLIEEIEGREEQVIFLEGRSGEEVRVEPDLFFDKMVLLPIDGWQVAQERKDALTFLVLRPHAEFREAEFLKQMGDELEKVGAKRPALKVEVVDELRRTKLGKLITIQALPREPHR
jgi:phenylacetate-CoA ligase